MDTKDKGADKGAKGVDVKQKLDQSEIKARVQASTKKRNVSWTERYWKAIVVALIALAGAGGFQAGKYNVLLSQQREMEKAINDNFGPLKDMFSDFFNKGKDVESVVNDNADTLKGFLMDKLHEYNILNSPSDAAPEAGEENTSSEEGQPEVANVADGSDEGKESIVSDEHPADVNGKVEEEKATESPKSEKILQPAFDASKAGSTYLTTEQLAEYDGSDESKPILIAVNGKVYDVSKGKKSYGKDGNYNVFAGKDATRMFATGKLDGVSGGDLEQLNNEQLKGLEQWEDFYAKHPDYTHVANLAA